MTTSPKLIAAGTVLAVLLDVAAPASASTCFDRVTISAYDPALIRAIQKRLHERGLYSGPADGRAGRTTRVALARLTGWSVKSDFRLGSDLVEKIFGQGYGGIYWPEDQDQLLEKLRLTPDPKYKNPCRVHDVNVVPQ